MGFFQRMFKGRTFFGRFAHRGCASARCGHGHDGKGHDGKGTCAGQPDPEKVEKRTAQILDRALDWIKATPEQRPQLHTLRADLVKDGLAMKAQKRETFDALWRMWDEERLEGLQVRQMLDERIDMLKGFLYRVGDRLVEVHRVLTPEQRKLIASRVRSR